MRVVPIHEQPLGRRVPSDWKHVETHRLSLVQPAPVPFVNRILSLPSLRVYYDQGQEGSCVGFGTSWALSIARTVKHVGPKYAAHWLYNQAQLVDEFSDTPPADGTSVRAAFDVLRSSGTERVVRSHTYGPDVANGVVSNSWATSVDDIRTAISNGGPIVLGINWYENFDHPQETSSGYMIGVGNLGRIRGGHCVCIYGASDKKQAVKIVNNWGMAYPLVWMPYDTLGRVLGEEGEAAGFILREHATTVQEHAA